MRKIKWCLISLTMMAILFENALSASALPIPLDLRTWKQEGACENGTWVVAEDGNSVFQTRNGENPTAFVAPESMIEKRITGQIRVGYDKDDDYFGLVFGFQDVNDFYLLDWKQGEQDGELPGLVFAHVTGGFESSLVISGHYSSPPDKDGYDVLWRHLGVGWGDKTTYEFIMDYTAEKVNFDINLLVNDQRRDFLEFSVDRTFSAGRFGVYNHSQPGVRYQDFTEETLCPGAVPDILAANLFSDTVMLEDQRVQRDPSVLVVTCGPVDAVKQVMRPPVTVNLTNITADLRFEVSDNNTATVGVFQEHLNNGMYMSIIHNISLPAVSTATLHNLVWQPVTAGMALSSESTQVAVFKTGDGEFLAMQIDSATGVQPVNLQLKRFSNAYCPSNQIETIKTDHVVPEPGTFLLFGMGIFGLIGLIRRTKTLSCKCSSSGIIK